MQLVREKRGGKKPTLRGADPDRLQVVLVLGTVWVALTDAEYPRLPMEEGLVLLPKKRKSAFLIAFWIEKTISL